MKLNSNFDSKLESTINLCQPLADWFERNQKDMAYLELTHRGCMHLENNPYAPVDAKVLGRMVNAGLTWLEEPDDMIIPKAKAFQAALAISNVYEQEKETLSEDAKTQYYLNVEELQKDDSQEKGRSL